MRVDQALVERGLASSRSQARRLIASGVQWRLADAPWKSVAKNGDEVSRDAELQLLDAAEARYVSRGGLKLEAALLRTGIPVTVLVCLDVGQSTGGFTDCLLAHGARTVYGVDVGSGQLHPRLRADPRVVVLEKINARSLSAADLLAASAMSEESAEDFTARFPLIVADLSFISLTLVLPALVPLLQPGGALLLLVKPQFELQPGQLGKGGIVKDPALFRVVENRMREACAALGLQVRDWFDSPIAGGDGNREFFIHATPIAHEPP